MPGAGICGKVDSRSAVPLKDVLNRMFSMLIGVAW